MWPIFNRINIFLPYIQKYKTKKICRSHHTPILFTNKRIQLSFNPPWTLPQTESSAPQKYILFISEPAYIAIFAGFYATAKY